MKDKEKKSFDVLGLGCTAVDDLFYVPSFPAPDEKVQVERSVRRFGGLTGVALITAARLGARCAYAGCLGTDELSLFVAGHFAEEGVDLAHAPRPAKAVVVRSTIVVGDDTGSRNVFFQNQGLIGAHDSLPAAKVIRASRVLFIDQYGMRGNLRAARVARAAGVAVVADFEDDTVPLFPEVLGCVDHLILSEDFALRTTQEPNAALAALALWDSDRATVLVTCGAKGCWSVSADHPRQARHHPAFAVRATDTTGCGDVFHGAYAASLARNDSLEQRIRLAAAAAAIKAMNNEIPCLAAAQAFLQAHPGQEGPPQGVGRQKELARVAAMNEPRKQRPISKP